MKGLEADYGDDWVFLSHYAFAHHEVGLTEEAFRLAERSLELSPTNAYAAHSVAHVYFETGEHSSGGDFLGGWLVGYDDRAPFHGHLSWHLALFELAMGRYQRVLELYQDNIRPSVLAKSAISLADSASLLWRMQMYTGSAPPAPWEEVVDQAAPAAEGPGPAFRDAHAALAFAASRDEEALERLTGRLRDLSEKGDLLAREVTLPLVEGIVSFAQGSYDEAVQSIEPACAQLTRIGGSHAQREVFEDTLLEAYLRAEQFESAEGMLRRRLIRRTSVRDLFWMGRAQASDGQPEEASSSLSQATQRWASADPRCPELRALKELVDKVAG